MAGRFLRLSESTVQSARFTGGNTVTEAKMTVAEVLREDKNNIDIVEKGAIVDGIRLVKDMESPLHVVVHNSDRQLPYWRQTEEKDIVNPWEEEPRCLMSCGHALSK
ncbi:hypothetical protein KP79_PYT00959 [Mizuhopecten yessoensis]|uniref:Uncharacterized protein n=1 Tax=Mizuhopecten yessoensis TaxID=6573 RepID=A0A210QMJ3_MIZYE|nr:hypothetical protein KP79_PYT00959 [Mizuhopecten yessoensis]